MFILGVFVNLWAVITVHTFYSVFMSLLEMSILIFTVTFNHLLFILYCKTHSTLLMLDNYFSSTFLWHFRLLH